MLGLGLNDPICVPKMHMASNEVKLSNVGRYLWDSVLAGLMAGSALM